MTVMKRLDPQLGGATASSVTQISATEL